MTPHEIFREVRADFDTIMSTSIDRLVTKYNRERIKRKVPKEKEYMRCYPLKSARKNPWLIFICKSTETERFKGSAGISGVTYYYGKQGIRAIEVLSNKVNVYNGHLFSRYNERLGLGITLPIDRITRFFTVGHSGVSKEGLPDEFGRTFHILLTSEGVALGESQSDDLWIVFKTFVSNDMLHKTQRQSVQSIQRYIEMESDQQQDDPIGAKEEHEWLPYALENLNRSSLFTNILETEE